MIERILQLVFNVLIFALIVLLLKVMIVPMVRSALAGKRFKKTENEDIEQHFPEAANELSLMPPDMAAQVDELFEEVGSLTPESFEIPEGSLFEVVETPSPLVPVAFMSHWRLATSAEILALPPGGLGLRGVIMDGQYRIEEIEDGPVDTVRVHKLIKRVPLMSGDGGPGFLPESEAPDQPSPLTIKCETGVFMSVQDRETIDQAVELFGDMADPFPKRRGKVRALDSTHKALDKIEAGDPVCLIIDDPYKDGPLSEHQGDELRKWFQGIRLGMWYREWLKTDALRLLSTGVKEP